MVKNNKKRILILDDDQYVRENIKLTLNNPEYFLEESISAEDALIKCKNNIYDLAIVDVKLKKMSGIEFIKKIKLTNNYTKFIAITGYSDEKSIQELSNIQVEYFLKKPYDENVLQNFVKQLLKIQSLEEQFTDLTSQPISITKNTDCQKNKKVVGVSEVFKTCLLKANKVASFQMHKLISGETGTGKEVIANYIHQQGPRCKEKFIAINCAELSSTLFDSELFGHQEGSFTGATESKMGLLELANNGILFLDEITEIPLNLQAKLLRVIDDQKVRRISSSQWKQINIQILASTNRNIEKAIDNGFLRKDLYYRLSTTQIYIPPIKDRIEDISVLVNHFLKEFSKLHGLKIKKIDSKSMELLSKFKWPGNVRQIKNFAKSYAMFCNELKVQQILNSVSKFGSENITNKLKYIFKDGSFGEIEKIKEMLIENAMEKYNGNKSKAAKHLGITYQGLLKYLKKHELV